MRLEVLSELRQRGVDIPTIMISGEGEISDAVQAIKLGAYDYLRKPVDPPHLRVLLNNFEYSSDSRRGESTVAPAAGAGGELGRLVGHSAPMRRIIALIEQVAPSSASVVILGESGTGKELVARTIHELSPRHAGPYVAINCAALPETLMESELFGHERGAFTGADHRREGCFELASGGTLLLDEIGEMKPELQAKLLRVLEEGDCAGWAAEPRFRLTCVCSPRPTATSRRRCGMAVFARIFYRLNVFTIDLPPLSDHADDIAALVEHFMRGSRRRPVRPLTASIPRRWKILKAYGWPGNVRQLRNVVERALIVTRGPLIGVADLPRI